MIWRRVGREPSGGPFNALSQVEFDRGIPRNPFVNAGALVPHWRIYFLAVVPNRCALAVWGPGLDATGNSCAGLAALDAFTTHTGWSVF